jgi:hypothetical protein
MKAFDPIQDKRVLDSEVGYEWALGRDVQKSKAVGGLASSAHADLNMAIKCFLVGYDKPADLLLKHALNWLNVAIKEKEKPRAYVPNGDEARRHVDLALCSWLLNNIHDRDNFREFIEFSERYFDQSPAGSNKENISLALPHYVDAAACGEALNRFAKAHLSEPESLASIRSEGQMCYVICRHRLGDEYSSLEVRTAVGKFLKRSVNAWLVDGHYLRAAEWMKIAHWSEKPSEVSAKEAVLKCYDYLNGVAKPW